MPSAAAIPTRANCGRRRKPSPVEECQRATEVVEVLREHDNLRYLVANYRQALAAQSESLAKFPKFHHQLEVIERRPR